MSKRGRPLNSATRKKLAHEAMVLLTLAELRVAHGETPRGNTTMVGTKDQVYALVAIQHDVSDRYVEMAVAEFGGEARKDIAREIAQRMSAGVSDARLEHEQQQLRLRFKSARARLDAAWCTEHGTIERLVNEGVVAPMKALMVASQPRGASATGRARWWPRSLLAELPKRRT